MEEKSYYKTNVKMAPNIRVPEEAKVLNGSMLGKMIEKVREECK